MKQNIIKSAVDERRKKADQASKQQLQQRLTCIKEYNRYNGQQTGGVDVKNLFRNLPGDVRNKLKHKVCLELLKKVSSLLIRAFL